MANHQIPRTAQRIERLYGVAADGSLVVCSVYEHTRQGHTRPVNSRVTRLDRSMRRFCSRYWTT